MVNNKPWFRQEFSRVHVGGECKCLHCGKEPIKLTESFMCDECSLEYGEFDSETFTTCDCCGRRIFVDESWFIDGDDSILKIPRKFKWSRKKNCQCFFRRYL